jgi:uncharacterized membrane protein (DUF4010 family)
LLVVRGANEFFGEAGVYLASAITGITDVDAITLSAAELASLAQIESIVASTAILLASLVNTLAKATIAWVIGTPVLRRSVAVSYGLVLVVGIVSSVLVLTL